MSDYKWAGKGVFSFEGKDYGHGVKMPEVPSETLKSLKKRKLVEIIAKTTQKAAEAEVAAKAAEKAAKKEEEENKNETK